MTDTRPEELPLAAEAPKDRLCRGGGTSPGRLMIPQDAPSCRVGLTRRGLFFGRGARYSCYSFGSSESNLKYGRRPLRPFRQMLPVLQQEGSLFRRRISQKRVHLPRSLREG
jgi:hypothetical protein